MEITSVAYVGAILGSVSIFLDLMFLVIKLKKNIDQARAANIGAREQQYSQYTRYRLQSDNMVLVVKERKG